MDGLLSLPVNLSERTLALVRLEGPIRNEADAEAVSALRIEDAEPIRRFYAWKGKRNYEGLWWSSTNGAHVGFESLLEREYLMAADASPDAIAISSQPMALLWPKGTPRARSHVPDFFVRQADGFGRLVDVKHPDRVRVSEQQFQMTRQYCQTAGWSYEVFTGLREPRLSNLRWLSAYRLPRYTPPAEQLPRLIEPFREPTSMAAGILEAVRSTGEPRGLVHAWILHLAHAGTLHVDLDRALMTGSSVCVAGVPR